MCTYLYSCSQNSDFLVVPKFTRTSLEEGQGRTCCFGIKCQSNCLWQHVAGWLSASYPRPPWGEIACYITHANRCEIPRSTKHGVSLRASNLFLTIINEWSDRGGGRCMAFHLHNKIKDKTKERKHCRLQFHTSSHDGVARQKWTDLKAHRA